MEARIQSSAANLAEDVILEILLWLPLVSIVRFRCVCKSWHKLLDQKFLDTKLKNSFKLLVTKQESFSHKTIFELKSLISDEGAVEIMHPFKKSSGFIRILGSCNGLVCATNGAESVFYVWNPCTAEYKEIWGFRELDRYANCLSHGFGYDSKTRDYKFVAIFQQYLEYNEAGSRVYIYTLSSGSWKSNTWFWYQISNGEPGVYLNGALHWLADTDWQSMSMSEDFERRVIPSFDMEEEKFKKIRLPAEHMDDFQYEYVSALRGCLCLFCSVSEVTFEIWEMKDYGVTESWSKLFKVDNQQLMSMGIPNFCHIRRAVSLKDGEILLEINKKGKREVDVVRIHLEQKKGYVYMKNVLQMEAYVESLVSVNSGKFLGDELRGS